MMNQLLAPRLDARDMAVSCPASVSGMAIRTAFQPIVDTRTSRIFAHEALVRGPSGEGAGDVFAAVARAERYVLDQHCRNVAIQTAARLGLGGPICLNFMPNGIATAGASIDQTLRTAEECDIPLENLIFEFTECEAVSDLHRLRTVFEAYRAHGCRTAIDDFGAGYSGLLRLADLRPDILKLDMALIRGIEGHARRHKIVAAIADLCRDLDIALVAEGVETAAEQACLDDIGITLMQGYLFARPMVDGFARPADIPLLRRAA